MASGVPAPLSITAMVLFRSCEIALGDISAEVQQPIPEIAARLHLCVGGGSIAIGGARRDVAAHADPVLCISLIKAGLGTIARCLAACGGRDRGELGIDETGESSLPIAVFLISEIVGAVGNGS